jgi:HK97 family phage major capsid protein
VDETPKDKWTPAHNDQFDALVNEIDALDGRIERFEKMLDLTAEERKTAAVQDAVDRVDHDSPEAKRNSSGFLAWMRGGKDGFKDHVAKQVSRGAGIMNTMDTTVGADGGFTVQSDVVATVIDALKQYGGMRAVSKIIKTDAGNPINYPTSNGTAEVGEILDQNTQASSEDISFGTLPLPVFKYSSKYVTVPIELLQDSSVDIEEFVRHRIATRLGRIMNQHFTVGTGVDQPNGLITAAVANGDIGKVGLTGETLTLIYDDLIDLIHSVDPAYRDLGNCQFMMNDQTLRTIRKVKDNNGRPLWMPLDEGLTAGLSGSLCGYPYTTNQQMPVMAANAYSVAFGDMSFYVIRDVMQMTFYRFDDSAFASKGQVGFLAFLRSGGNFMDVGGAVKLFQNSAT